MAKEIRYIIRYPGTSSIVTKQEVDAGYCPPFLKDTHSVTTFRAAHDILKTASMQRLIKARDELQQAVDHLDKVMNLSEDDVK